MGKIITIANQKGGVGKTTTALCLGAQLEARGYKVLYIDLDSQKNTSKVLRADTSLKGSYSLLKGDSKVKDLIQVTELNAHIISANADLIGLNAPNLNTRARLNEIIDEYDYIVIDTPPTLNYMFISALSCTDYLMIIANTDTFSTDGIKDMQEIINSVQEINKGLKINGILVERFNGRAKVNRAIKEILEQLASAYNTKTYNTFIRENTAIRESQASKERITTFAPSSNGNKDYSALCDEVLQDLEKRG